MRLQFPSSLRAELFRPFFVLSTAFYPRSKWSQMKAEFTAASSHKAPILESVPRSGKRHHVETSDTQFGRKKVTTCAFAPRFKNLGAFRTSVWNALSLSTKSNRTQERE